MNALMAKVLSCKNVEELRLVHSYLRVKRSLEKNLGFKLHVKGWVSLFERINSLKTAVSKRKDELEKAIDIRSFMEAKRQVNKILGIQLKAKERSKLKHMIQSLISLFSDTALNPHERYEAIKRRNFIHSSRLEGIEIPASKPEQLLENIIAKYRVPYG